MQQAVPRQQVQAFRLTLAAAAAARRPLISRGFAASAAPVAGGDAADREVVDAVLSCASGTTCELPADKGVLARLAACAAEQAPALSPDQIRNLLVSFAQLKYHNIPFKTAMVDAIISKMGQFEPAALADAAWAFGQAEYYDYELMSQLMTYLRDNADRFDASSMAKVRWGSAGDEEGEQGRWGRAAADAAAAGGSRSQAITCCMGAVQPRPWTYKCRLTPLPPTHHTHLLPSHSPLVGCDTAST